MRAAAEVHGHRFQFYFPGFEFDFRALYSTRAQQEDSRK